MMATAESPRPCAALVLAADMQPGSALAVFAGVENKCLAEAGGLLHRIVTMKEHERRIVLRNLGGGLSEIRGKSADNVISLLGEGLDYYRGI